MCLPKYRCERNADQETFSTAILKSGCSQTKSSQVFFLPALQPLTFAPWLEKIPQQLSWSNPSGISWTVLDTTQLL